MNKTVITIAAVVAAGGVAFLAFRSMRRPVVVGAPGGVARTTGVVTSGNVNPSSNSVVTTIASVAPAVPGIISALSDAFGGGGDSSDDE